MNRRSFLKKALASTLGLLGLSGGTYYYAREIEPSMLTIHKETLSSNKIPTQLDDLTILQFSDTHVGFHYSLEQLEELVYEINAQSPDIVVFTGDLVDMPNEFPWGNGIIEILNKIKAPMGKYWIYGNHDHGGYGTETLLETMEAGGFSLLQNSHVEIEKQGAAFTLAGLDDLMLGKPDLEEALKNADPDNYTMLLVHEPDYADNTINYQVDCQLSGHSHGGQIQIPLIGYIYTPKFAEKYVEGKYLIDEKLELFVSRGVGTTRLPYRFLCRPEITVFKMEASS
ncbi:metallophosphoesterase [Sediminibacillus massiliensis]|uniref:metallophosphoesterase n=1 Tax=Sediminibacillus massiliensis TaxID=1926277 RepID=UPI000988381A|nr:metallophosphoesterase [Sediminibacillus massiliensis]